MEMYQIILLAVAAVIGVLYVFQRLTGVSILEKIIHWRPVVVAIGATLKAVAGALPSEDLNKVIIVLEAACTGAETAESLWLMGQLPKEERNEYAQLLVADVLKKAGIEVTEQVQMIIDGGIEMMCMLMPHGEMPRLTNDN